LTEAVRRKPFSVVLFDEIEKAHPDVFNTLLQILEDGHLTDAQGHTVDFKNTVIIMTSNLGTRDIQKGAGVGFAAHSDEQVTYAAKALPDQKGYDPTLGARPLRRTIQRLVEDPLSEKLLWKEYKAGQTIIVDGRDGEVVFEGTGLVPPDTPPVELAGQES